MNKAKPFLKWAGGKSQLLGVISTKLPAVLKKKHFTYIEPFVGSGAMLFWMLQEYGDNIESVVINDINCDLINTYRVIKNNPNDLISILKELEYKYHEMDADSEDRKLFYYDIREKYNQRNSENIKHAALFVFLNRTCFNGLYRVNRKNEFNVPIGSYKNPKICDAENLLNVSDLLQNVTILTGDYNQILDYSGNLNFVYFDPPYKPLSKTSSFNSYSKDEFGDEEQERLQSFCDLIHQKGFYWMVSNSDTSIVDPSDSYFDDLYQKYNIERVVAKRMISAKSSKRGPLNELLIRNYE